jgi:hypothetical protein
VGQVLNLKPEEVDGLFDLLAKHEANELESFGANAASREARFQSVAQQKQVNEAELVSLLGSKYSQWTEYKRDLPLRLQVRDLGAVLSANGTPLSDSQARLLLPALVSAKKQIDPRSAPLSPERSRTLVEAASNYLSPDQVDAYRRMLNRQQDSLSQFLPPTMEVTNSPTSLPD